MSAVRKCRPAQMRASMISLRASEKRSKERVSPGKRLLVTPNRILSVPKNICNTSRCALSPERWPDGCSGYGAVRSGAHDGSGSVSGLPSLSACRIAVHGRQKSQEYLSVQQLIAEPAALRFILANK